jgi:NAD(P)-dependent dehydrogenase (short-subunit alcohol dehydrogenase family)
MSAATSAVGAPGAAQPAATLAGMTALVTGASRGIGRAIAHSLAGQGANLCLMATDAARLAEVESSLAGLPGRCLSLALDVTDRAACREAVARASAEFGRIDILVNNAGIHHAGSFLSHEPEDFQRLLDVNLFGVIHMTQAVLPGMIERGYGRIVNIASTAGKWGSRNQAGYNVSKHAVVGLTRCVALETAAQGVTVNAICPGFVDTDMMGSFRRDQAARGVADPAAAIEAMLAARVPIGRALRTDEIAGLALYLASPQSSGMTGQSIIIDGGMLTA